MISRFTYKKDYLVIRWMETPEYHETLHECRNHYVKSLTARFFYNQAQNFYIKYPENWVESVKERFLPGLLLKYFPVKYIIHDIKYKEVYGNMPAVPKNIEAMQVMDCRVNKLS